jgi:hypothetical protein
MRDFRSRIGRRSEDKHLRSAGWERNAIMLLSLCRVVCGPVGNDRPGAQTERRGVAAPMSVLLRGRTHRLWFTFHPLDLWEESFLERLRVVNVN